MLGTRTGVIADLAVVETGPPGGPPRRDPRGRASIHLGQPQAQPAGGRGTAEPRPPPATRTHAVLWMRRPFSSRSSSRALKPFRRRRAWTLPQALLFPLGQAAAPRFFFELETETPAAAARLIPTPAPPSARGPRGRAGGHLPAQHRLITSRGLASRHCSRLPQEGVRPQTLDPPVHLCLEIEERIKRQKPDQDTQDCSSGGNPDLVTAERQWYLRATVPKA